MNAFEKHGLQHLSPSSCATFTAAPALWVMEKLLGKRQPVGTAAHRGSAAETGVALALEGAPLQEAQDAALTHFDRAAALSGDPRRAKHREGVPGFVEQGLLALRHLGAPENVQGKVSRSVDGLAVPIIGFYDFAWPGLIVDLKTTDAVPTNIRTSHARQVALYATCMGGNWSGQVCYASSKKHALANVEAIPEHAAALDKIALTIQRFLSLSDDPLELAGLLMPDIESFYFSDPLARQAAFDVFGI